MVAKETADTIEKTLDVIEDTLETVERIPKVHLNGTSKKQQLIILGVTAAVAAFAGGGATYFFIRGKLRMHYESIAEEEIAAARRYYKTGEYADPVALADKIEETRQSYSAPETPLEHEEELEAFEAARETPKVLADVQLHSISLDPEPGPHGGHIEVVEEHNIFTDNVPDVPTVQELKARENSDEPYIITHAEFYVSDKDYEQINLTYYEGDDVLADDKDIPVADSDGTVGDDNLTKFGDRSKDPNVVFVRNETLKADFEITRSKGSFAEEVAGFIQHSDDRRRRPRRWGEDE